MAGISSKALKSNYSENKRGYNGNEIQSKEFEDGGGLELYDFNARIYDQQISRFLQIDPDVEQYDQEKLSPYHFAINNPILNNDPDGRHPIQGILKLGRVIFSILKAADKVAAVKKIDVDALIRSISPMAPTNEAIQEMKAEAAEREKSKDVPNPNGKNGGPEHQRVVNEQEERLVNEGYDKVEREVMVKTPDGEKSKRFVDLQGTNTKTGEIKQIQVGKQNKTKMEHLFLANKKRLKT